MRSLEISFPGYIILTIPILITIISFIVVMVKIIKSKDAKNEWIVCAVSLYVTLLAAYFALFENQLNTRFSEIQDMYSKSLNLNTEVLNKPKESDLNLLIERKIEQFRDSSNLRPSLMRSFYSPGLLPGVRPDQDDVFGSLFFARSFHLSYFIGFPWENKKPNRVDTECQQLQMSKFLFSLLIYNKWQDKTDIKTILKMKEIFHTPIHETHDYWIIEGNNQLTSGIAYLNGYWSGMVSRPVRESVLLINHKSTCENIRRDLNSLRDRSVEHLKTELNKKYPWERCICTLFAGDDPREGLQPMSYNNFLEKIDRLSAQFKMEFPQKKLSTYFFNILYEISSSIKPAL